jgi:hypothetical protein
MAGTRGLKVPGTLDPNAKEVEAQAGRGEQPSAPGRHAASPSRRASPAPPTSRPGSALRAKTIVHDGLARRRTSEGIRVVYEASQELGRIVVDGCLVISEPLHHDVQELRRAPIEEQEQARGALGPILAPTPEVSERTCCSEPPGIILRVFSRDDARGRPMAATQREASTTARCPICTWRRLAVSSTRDTPRYGPVLSNCSSKR